MTTAIPRRPAAVAGRAMVATSQPLATQAGLAALKRGGNAVDAALAAAAMLCVTEPMSTGVGGDVFALVWRDGVVEALDAAGPAPRTPSALRPVAKHGPQAVNVPGAVRGWQALAERYGRLGLADCLQDAIEVADGGFAVGSHCARMWSEARVCPPSVSPVPRRGTRVRLPELGATLRRIAREGPDVLYAGELAAGIAASCWLDEEDLAVYRPQWTTPLRLTYGGIEVLEMPPPTQGVMALEALGLLAELGPGFGHQVAAARLALADAFGQVRDGADVSALLEPEFLRRRAQEPAVPVPDTDGGTVCLSVVDEDGMAISFIQSLFEHFGAGVEVPGTGVVLNNRGACFSINGEVLPGRRPFHTLVPGMLLRDGKLLGPFGIMGGYIQAQAHMQFVAAVADEGLDPQQALDRPRFRINEDTVHLERGLWDRAGEVEALGLSVMRDEAVSPFGGGQAIFVSDDALLGGSDLRKDGYAAGY